MIDPEATRRRRVLAGAALGCVLVLALAGPRVFRSLRTFYPERFGAARGTGRLPEGLEPVRPAAPPPDDAR